MLVAATEIVDWWRTRGLGVSAEENPPNLKDYIDIYHSKARGCEKGSVVCD